MRTSAVLWLAVLTGPTAAQSPFLLAGSGDAVPGAGTVTHVEAVHVDDSGWWLVQVATDDPQAPSAVLSEGVVWKQVGEPYKPNGKLVVTGFDRLSQDLVGTIGWSGTVTRPDGAPADAQIVSMDGGSGLLTGTPTDVWAPDFPPGTLWRSFGEVRFAVHGDLGVVTGSVGLPASPGVDTDFLAVAHEYGSWGVCCIVDLLALEGQVPKGQTETVEGVRHEPWAARVDDAGSAVYWGCDLVGATGSDGCVYRCALATGSNTLLAREGAPSPVAGRAWGALEDLALDACGASWTLRTFLDASDAASDGILVRNGVKLVQEGDVLPALAPFALVDLGHGRGVLDFAGSVLWYGAWNDPAAPAEGLFLDGALLVRAGVTKVAGEVLADLDAGPHSYARSSDGHYVVFTGTLANGVHGAFAINLGENKIYCKAKPNSKSCFLLNGFTGTPSASAGSGFALRTQNVLGQVTGLLLYGTTGPQVAPLLDATLCVEPPLRRLPPIGSGGSLPPASTCDGLLQVDFNAWVATGGDPALSAGTTVFAQYWARDPGFVPPLDFVLSQGFEFTLGP